MRIKTNSVFRIKNCTLFQNPTFQRSPESSTKSNYITLIPSGLLVLSEFLPFTNHDANGIIDGLKKLSDDIKNL